MVTRGAIAYGLLLGAMMTVAQAHSPEIRPGLWETQAQTSLPGGMAMPDASQLPPEIVAKLAQRGISLQGGAGGALVARACITKEQAARGEIPQPPDRRCQNSNYLFSGQSLSWQITCASSGGRFMSGQGNVLFATPESYAGSLQITVTESGRGSLTSTTQLRGHWVGECH